MTTASPPSMFTLWAQLSPLERAFLISICTPNDLWRLQVLALQRIRWRNQDLANRGRVPETVTRHEFARWLVRTGRVSERCRRIGIERGA